MIIAFLPSWNDKQPNNRSKRKVSGRRYLSRNREFPFVCLFVEASKWVLLSNRLMSQMMWRHPRLLLMGMFPLSSGHRDHLVDAWEGSAVPERADVAPERAVPGGSESHCGRPYREGLRPRYTIPKRRPQREQTHRAFIDSHVLPEISR